MSWLFPGPEPWPPELGRNVTTSEIQRYWRASEDYERRLRVWRKERRRADLLWSLIALPLALAFAGALAILTSVILRGGLL